LNSKAVAAAIIIVIAVITTVGVYFHDNPSAVTSIADINDGKVAAGENVTVKGRILFIWMLYMGPYDQFLTVGDGQHNVTCAWFTSPVYVGWVIMATGTVETNHSLSHIQSLERVWLFA
jgi:hypothetical protein